MRGHLKKCKTDDTKWCTQFGHRLPTGNGESAALDSAARSADYSISCGHPMAKPGIIALCRVHVMHLHYLFQNKDAAIF